jgi:cytochrome c oxidase cbb3-type subunit III
MSSRFLRNSVVLLAVAAAPLACAQDIPTDAPPQGVTASELFPGGARRFNQDPHDGPFRSDPTTLADGKRTFIWYNCGGCHFNGGGGIGPALMDDRWIYGNRIDQVFASIAQGRPNGMPAWSGKIPNAQIWTVAAYVLSLGQGQPQEPPAMQ